MDDDLIQLLIYVVIGLIGVIGSAYKSRMKKQQSRTTVVPRNMPASPEKDYGPELGPLLEMFDIPRPKPVPMEYETVESGPGVEEAGLNVDSDTSSAELAGMNTEQEGASLESEAREIVPETESYEEGQSDIQKMIARYEAIHRDLDKDVLEDEIAAGEILSVEAEERAREASKKSERFFDPRKAIIYSEILKRREN